MKKIIFTLLFASLFVVAKPCVYWENIPKCQQDSVLHLSTISDEIFQAYSGSFRLSDDTRSIALLDSISQLPEDSFLKALYFNVFNNILEKADGGIVELMGNYNLNLILSDPKYVINYFKKNPKLMRQYAQTLGYEFYFKKDGTSTIRYSFEEFKSILNGQLENAEYVPILNIFYNEIKSTMNIMN